MAMRHAKKVGYTGLVMDLSVKDQGGREAGLPKAGLGLLKLRSLLIN